MSINHELEKNIINLINIFNNKSFDEVIQQGIKLYKLNKISILPNLIGASYAGKAEHKQAIIYYEKALLIDSKNAEILNNLGKSQIELNLFAQAAKSFNVSIGIDKKNSDTYFNLGIAFSPLTSLQIKLAKSLIFISSLAKEPMLKISPEDFFSKIHRLKASTVSFIKVKVLVCCPLP